MFNIAQGNGTVGEIARETESVTQTIEHLHELKRVLDADATHFETNQKHHDHKRR